MPGFFVVRNNILDKNYLLSLILYLFKGEIMAKNITLITGATGGLGGAFARECALRGDNLFLTGTKKDRLEAITAEIKSSFPNIEVQSALCDLSDENQRKELTIHIKELGYNVNYLINNAGLITEGETLLEDDEKIIKSIRVNCEGTIDMTQKILKMRDKNEPLTILTVSSLAYAYPMPYMNIYSATKRMLVTFMTALAQELKGTNVVISVVCPSGIYTTKEMREAIASQGLAGKLSSHEPEYIVKFALKKASKKKLITIPGVFNRFLKTVSSPFSEKFLAKVVGNRWKKSQKKRNMK